MTTKKHIYRLFRERFKDFEATPPPQAWENIAAALSDKKKERKVVPLWFRFAGIAASLAVLLGLFNYFTSSDSSPDIQITDSDAIQRVEDADRKTDEFDSENTFANPVNDIQLVDVDFDSDTDELSEKSSETTSNSMAKSNKNSSYASSQYNSVMTSDETIAFRDEEDSDKIVEDKNIPSEIGATNTVEKKSHVFNLGNDDTETTVPETQVAVIEEKKSLIEYLQERDAQKEEIALVKETTENRWMVSPNVAPVYYNTLGNGSSIDPSLSNTSKSGEVNYSYGVQVGYAINNKLSVRTGINKVDVSYSTNNIEFGVAPASAGLQGLNYGGAEYVVTAGVRGTLPDYFNQIPNINGNQMLPRNENFEGVLNQQIGYFEVPLELKYNFLNSRFGINMVGGMSTFLLADNNVSVRSPEIGFETIIGEANNLSPISFSANLGLGFDYKISKRFVFNLEPMFKYQLNTYSDSEVDFSPYILGVYSGFSFKF